MLTFWAHQKFYTCSSSSRASTDLLARVCTETTVSLGKSYDKLEARQKEIADQAKQARVIRDERVAKINESIKKDIVFRRVEK